MDRDERRPHTGDGPVGGETDWRQVTQRHYDPAEDDELTTAIVYAIAAARDVPPVEVKSPPLYDVIDAAALEATFFGPGVAAGPRTGTGSVGFEYADYRVEVASDGWVQVFEPAGDDRQ